MTVTLLLVLQLGVVPGGDAAATQCPGAAAAAAAAGRAGATGGDAAPPRDVRGSAEWLFSYFDNAQVLAFRDACAVLGVSFHQLIDAEAAGLLGAYEAAINVGRAPPLNTRHAIMAYPAIMARLHDDGRCLDFVRQTAAVEAGSCAAEKWRRCCRRTANDADPVLLCAKHEHLLHPPALTAVTHATKSTASSRCRCGRRCRRVYPPPPAGRSPLPPSRLPGLRLGCIGSGSRWGGAPRRAATTPPCQTPLAARHRRHWPRGRGGHDVRALFIFSAGCAEFCCTTSQEPVLARHQLFPA